MGLRCGGAAGRASGWDWGKHIGHEDTKGREDSLYAARNQTAVHGLDVRGSPESALSSRHSVKVVA